MLHDELRISEALQADVTDLESIRGHRTITVTRKGGARRDVVLAPMTAEVVDAYVGDRETGPLFMTKIGNRLDQPGPSGQSGG